MKKTYLALAFLITGFLLAGDAYGEDEVYYCAEIESRGFYYEQKKGSYKRSEFTPEKFKIKFNSTLSTIEKAPEKDEKVLFKCSNPFVATDKPNLYFCTSYYEHFHFNSNNGKFIQFVGFGFVAGDHDAINVSYGKCDKF